MGKFSKDKGKRGERSTATDLREMFPELADNIRRGWQVREGDDDPDVVGIPGYWFEVKCGKSVHMSNALEQAASAATGSNAVPVAVIRVDRKKPIVVMYWSDFLTMIRRIYDYENRM